MARTAYTWNASTPGGQPLRAMVQRLLALNDLRRMRDNMAAWLDGPDDQASSYTTEMLQHFGFPDVANAQGFYLDLNYSLTQFDTAAGGIVAASFDQLLDRSAT